MSLTSGRNETRDAALDSAHRYFMPMFLATTCICLIFYPILLLFTGQFAEFIHFFPYTFTINLMVSLVLAVILIPILEVALSSLPVKAVMNRERKE